MALAAPVEKKLLPRLPPRPLARGFLEGLAPGALALILGVNLPANKIMELYRAGQLHSGRSGRVVHKPSQAKAILLSYLRKEGKPIPEKSQ